MPAPSSILEVVPLVEEILGLLESLKLNATIPDVSCKALVEKGGAAGTSSFNVYAKDE